VGRKQAPSRWHLGAAELSEYPHFAAVMDAYADDVVLDIHGEARGVGGEGAVGKNAVGEWFGDWFRTFDSDYRFEIDETRDWGIKCS
jgi:ketosteroid isomerase-like protein